MREKEEAEREGETSGFLLTMKRKNLFLSGNKKVVGQKSVTRFDERTDGWVVPLSQWWLLTVFASWTPKSQKNSMDH